MTEQEAINYVAEEAKAEQAPGLTPEELAACVRKRLRYASRVNSTAVAYGVSMSPGNGRLYRCSYAGTTAATPPTFPQDCGYRGQVIADGTVRWTDRGPAHAHNYDLNGAVHDAWLKKAAKTAHYINIKNGSDTVELSQRHAQELAMAAKYAPMEIR